MRGVLYEHKNYTDFPISGNSESCMLCTIIQLKFTHQLVCHLLAFPLKSYFHNTTNIYLFAFQPEHLKISLTFKPGAHIQTCYVMFSNALLMCRCLYHICIFRTHSMLLRAGSCVSILPTRCQISCIFRNSERIQSKGKTEKGEENGNGFHLHNLNTDTG